MNVSLNLDVAWSRTWIIHSVRLSNPQHSIDLPRESVFKYSLTIKHTEASIFGASKSLRLTRPRTFTPILIQVTKTSKQLVITVGALVLLLNSVRHVPGAARAGRRHSTRLIAKMSWFLSRSRKDTLTVAVPYQSTSLHLRHFLCTFWIS